MGLNAAKLEAVKPEDETYKLYDEKGLFLLVMPNGAMYWRFKYRIGGKEKLLSLGVFEKKGKGVSLAEAREARDDLRKLVRNGTDPSTLRKSAKVAAVLTPAPSAETMKTAATAWISYHRQGTPGNGRDWSDSYTEQVEKRLERHVFKRIGTVPVNNITGALLLDVLGPLSSDIQHRIKRDLHRVFTFAAIKGWRPDELKNPAADLEDLLKKRQPRKHFAGITDPTEFGGLLRATDCYTGAYIVRTLLRLSPLLFQRPTELRIARWNEFDLISGNWHIPASRMKSDQDHIVPLSRQAIAILEALRPETMTHTTSLLFPGERKRGIDVRPLCNATITGALANMGYRGLQTAHGFRASARTILVERLNVDERYVERQLDHLTKAPNGRAYDRTMFLAERRVMMQQWADYLDGLKDTPTVCLETTVASTSMAVITSTVPNAGTLPVQNQQENEGFVVRKIRRPPAGECNKFTSF